MDAIFEVAVFVGIALGLWIARLLFPSVFQAAARGVARLAQRRWLAISIVSSLAFAGSVLLAVLFGMPRPAVHDEFSYLLAADTFAHGRLTNPPHPLWENFETIHVNVQPTYHSMYPPGQGAVLALGQVLTGHPIVGVWLSMGAACGAICWMMQAWLPARWALFGALLATLRLVFAQYPGESSLCPGYWSHSYWGGAVAAIGGALVFGTVGRLVKPALGPSPSQREMKGGVQAVGNAVALGLGCAILANSRPFEGLVAAVYGFGVLALELSRRGGWRIVLKRIALPVVAVLGPTGACMLYYNHVTTGNALQMPYQLNMATYSTTPVFLLGELRQAPEYRYDARRRFYLGWVRSHFTRQQSLAGFLEVAAEKLRTLGKFFCSPLLVLPLVAMLSTLRCWTTRFALLGCLTAIWALAHVTWLEPHYLAPVAGLFYLLAAQGSRSVAASRWFRPWLGSVFAPALVLTLALSTGVSVWKSTRVIGANHWTIARTAIESRLLRAGGRHVVLVPERDTAAAQSLVYNPADIDGAPIVWAHETSGGPSHRLLGYFGDRHIWRPHSSESSVERPKLETIERPVRPALESLDGGKDEPQ